MADFVLTPEVEWLETYYKGRNFYTERPSSSQPMLELKDDTSEPARFMWDVRGTAATWFPELTEEAA